MVKNLRVFNSKVLNKHAIHRLIHLLKNELGIAVSALEISFVDSSQIVKVNKNYLQHNHSTDIITFQYSEDKDYIEGELIISEEDAVKNAIRYKTSDKEEVTRLIIHGLLHLLGYDDQNVKDKKVMKAIENNLFVKFKFLTSK